MDINQTMPDSIAVLQARTTSSRLPAKSLLPIGGYPLAVLSAKRAANTGRNVLVVTSTEPSDDALAKAMSTHNIRCYRGSLSNPLERFVLGLSDYDDDTLVFRLTADNAFPDGHLLDSMEAFFLENKLEYLSCGGPESGLPYGVSAELTRLVHLREAYSKTDSAYDKEHVTPYIRRKFAGVFDAFSNLGKSHFRATVDTIDDYLSVERVFACEANPLDVSFLKLIERLKKAPNQPIFEQPRRRFVLGTAQLGMPYGIANVSGQPSQEESTKIIRTAITNGVEYIDTARAYGKSELVVGRALRGGWADQVKVISKLSPMANCPQDASRDVVEAFVDASIYQSCANLGTNRLEVLMLHRADHLERWDGMVLGKLRQLVADRLIGSIGVSVQSAAELENALLYPEIGIIQFPFNIFDWRFDSQIPAIRKAQQELGLVIHTRSALLQGLLPTKDLQSWQAAGVTNPKLAIAWLSEQAQDAGFNDVASFCLAYCFSQDWINGVVVGIETHAQITQNLEDCINQLSQGELTRILDERPKMEEATLNPALWTAK